MICFVIGYGQLIEIRNGILKGDRNHPKIYDLPRYMLTPPRQIRISTLKHVGITDLKLLGHEFILYVDIA